MPHEYKVGDKVRRNIKDPDVPLGTLGTVVEVGQLHANGDQTIWCDFDNGERRYGALSTCIELYSPAVTPSPSSPSFIDRLTQNEQQPAAPPINPWEAEHDRVEAELNEVKPLVAELTSRLDTAMRANRRAVSENGDLRGENATLRARLAIAERSLELAVADAKRRGRK